MMPCGKITSMYLLIPHNDTVRFERGMATGECGRVLLVFKVSCVVD